MLASSENQTGWQRYDALQPTRAKRRRQQAILIDIISLEPVFGSNGCVDLLKDLSRLRVG